MTRPTVLVLSFTDIERDPRVRRHVDALSVEFNVITCGKGHAPDGAVAHVELPAHVSHLPVTPIGLVTTAIGDHRSTYGQITAAAEAGRLLRDMPFDVLLANDAVTLPVALAVAAGRPVVADMHEYAPREMEEDWRWRLLVQRLATDTCRQFLPKCAAVVTVAPGIAAEYEREFGVRTHVVTNAGPARAVASHAVGGTIRLVHSGNANPNRGLEVMVDAVAGLPGFSLDLFLVPAPRAGRYLDDLRASAAATPNIDVHDPVPMAEVVPTLARFDLGVYVLAPTNFNNEHALPNKFFDFVQAGLGIVVGPSPEMAALVRDHGLGTVTGGFTAADLRATLSGLDVGTVESWRAATRAAAEELGSSAQADRLRAIVNDTLAAGGLV